jgi:hypothetical protein
MHSAFANVFREVDMQLMSRTTIVGSADVISGILNWVCPGCGGRMGGHGKEFKCQGECLTDWRLIWERILSVEVNASSRPVRPI